MSFFRKPRSPANGWRMKSTRLMPEERERKETLLFPIRIDDDVMTTPEPWARKLLDQRNIGDFRRWKKPAEYHKSLDRLLRDLRTKAAS